VVDVQLPRAADRDASTATATPAASASRRCATSASSPNASTFSLSEARLGLLPATISPYVVRAMGEQAARRYFVTAERFGAAEARRAASRTRCARRRRSTTSSAASTGDRRQRADGDARVQAARRDVAGREISAELRADTARRIADIRASAEGREGIESFLGQAQPGVAERQE
jgi:methylglutaconyl-CoA hydratase